MQKKILVMGLCALSAMGLAGCKADEKPVSSSSIVDSSDVDSGSDVVKNEGGEVTSGIGSYTVYNTTGEIVKELYLYEVGEEKGSNLAGGGIAVDAAMPLMYSAQDSSAVLVLEFVTESGYEGKFETLHIEEAPISLLSADAAAGATIISFKAPEYVGVEEKEEVSDGESTEIVEDSEAETSEEKAE